MSRKGNLSVIRTKQGWQLNGPGCGALNRFLARIDLKGLAESSIRTYAFDLISILRWMRKRKKSVKRLRREDLYEFIRDKRGEVQAVTVNRMLRLLHRFMLFQNAEEPEPVTFRGRCRVGSTLPCVKEPTTIKQPLTDRQVKRLVDSLKTIRDRAIIGLMWAMGLRIGEVLSLRLEDVDWEHGTLQVHGKGNRQRCLPLAEPLALLIRRYLAFERPTTALLHIFVVLKGRRRGSPMTYAGARRIFRYYRQRLKLPDAHPHRFRHTFAVNMIRQGMSVPALMRLMGHTWAQTTFRYVHFDDREVRENYEKALAKLDTPQNGTSENMRSIF